MNDQAVIEELGPEALREMYRRMVRIRVFDSTLENLVDTGELVGSIHTSIGQEGVCVGACMAVRADDYMTGHHRSHGHPIGKGVPLEGLTAELFGKRTGVCRGLGGSMHLADFSSGSLGEAAIVASSLPIAVGAALTSKLEGQGRVALAFFGDGASNEGVFHEAMNMAAVWSLPVVFMCENNQYAVSTRHEEACSVKQIAERGAAYSMPAETIDGQNALEVWSKVRDAAEHARSGQGPVLIEAMTYRYGDHSYLMNRLKYRTDDEVDVWRQRDPIKNLGAAMISANVAAADDLEAIQDEVERDMAACVERAREAEPPTSEELWELMYVDPSGFRERRHHQAWMAATATR